MIPGSESKVGTGLTIKIAAITVTMLDMMVKRSHHGTTTNKITDENFRILASRAILNNRRL